MERIIRAAARTGFAIVIVSCAGDVPPLEVADPRAPAPVSVTDAMAVYFTMTNHQPMPDTLHSSWVEGAAAFSIHRNVARGGMMTMVVVPTVVIPAGGELRLEPGATHGMVTGMTQEFTPGDTVRVTLEFAHAGAVTVDVPVVTYAEIGG